MSKQLEQTLKKYFDAGDLIMGLPCYNASDRSNDNMIFVGTQDEIKLAAVLYSNFSKTRYISKANFSASELMNIFLCPVNDLLEQGIHVVLQTKSGSVMEEIHVNSQKANDLYLLKLDNRYSVPLSEFENELHKVKQVEWHKTLIPLIKDTLSKEKQYDYIPSKFHYGVSKFIYYYFRFIIEGSLKMVQLLKDGSSNFVINSFGRIRVYYSQNGGKKDFVGKIIDDKTAFEFPHVYILYDSNLNTMINKISEVTKSSPTIEKYSLEVLNNLPSYKESRLNFIFTGLGIHCWSYYPEFFKGGVAVLDGSTIEFHRQNTNSAGIQGFKGLKVKIIEPNFNSDEERNRWIKYNPWIIYTKLQNQ